jgi:hypothetical protein
MESSADRSSGDTLSYEWSNAMAFPDQLARALNGSVMRTRKHSDGVPEKASIIGTASGVRTFSQTRRKAKLASAKIASSQKLANPNPCLKSLAERISKWLATPLLRNDSATAKSTLNRRSPP